MAVTDNTRPPAALPPGTRLDEFELRRVLGIGGFGIVYLAFDHALEREVAIKEYMPASLVGRSGDGPKLSLLSETHADSFSLGLRSFVNEARLLARFDAPGLVKVHRYWEANNTAYMAMPFYTGSNLHAVRRRMDGPPDEAWLRGILQPLLGALERLHREGIYHRDISPDNVILQPDGQPVLLDFGAARRVIGDKSMALTAILKPAYAPIEQYAEVGAVKQGAWTDLYALGATLHFLLLGKAPPPATARAVEDEMPPLASQAALLARCSSGFLQAVDWMLRPRPADRPQTVAALRAALVPRDDPAAERTILDLSHLPPSPRAGRQHDDGDATVLLPRRDEPTVLIPKKPAAATPPPAPVRDEPTILMPRRDEPTVLMPRQDEVSLLLPLDGAPAVSARPAFQDTHEPTMRMPPPGAASPPPLQARRELPMPRPAAGTHPLLVAGVVVLLGAVALAAWLALKPAAAPATPPASTSPQAPADPAPAAASTTGAAALAPVAGTAAGPAATPVATTTAAPAAVAAPPDTAPAPRSEPPRAAAAKAGPDSAAPKPARAPTTAATQRDVVTAAEAPAPAAAPAPTGGPPSLATSITRLPPAAEPAPAAGARTNSPNGGPGPGSTAEPARSSPGAAAPAPAAPAAPTIVAAARGPDTPVPRAATRDSEPMPLQTRALSPTERCDGRAGAALASCIDRLCKAEPGLREHADCAKARRDSATH